MQQHLHLLRLETGTFSLPEYNRLVSLQTSTLSVPEYKYLLIFTDHV